MLMLNMKACAVIAIFVTVTMSKNKFVFDDAKKAIQFGRDWAHANKLIQDDDGMMQNSAAKVRKLGNFGRGFTCKWKCRCDQPAAPKPVSNFAPIQMKTEIKNGMKFCMVNKVSGKALKVQANGELDQIDSSRCEDATLFMFKNMRTVQTVLFTDIYNAETNNFLVLEKIGNSIKALESKEAGRRPQAFLIIDNSRNQDKPQNNGYFYIGTMGLAFSIIQDGENKDHLFLVSPEDNDAFRFSIMVPKK